MQKVRAHLYIYGDVIGVGFRYWTVGMARKIGVYGWVKNLDNCVEAIIEGEKEKVERMIQACHEGPPTGRVEKIEKTWENYTGEYKDFVIARLAVI
ncbi:hypothetical protein A2773_07030 [Candidatus Gottesmanbacteria bacterium RIFCSPHIGHO2_01_FULL_39_10]|uniref:acylphosphatase n=1 Tax=Candidatus Gottesmanbacteria bacterium RIFCSPHIGHO2_01_FULL_39_10 TaxID=1798375 RepID=A0A1F5ZQP7_9BACT|nr:MAG: hypothetical protein A2773_07030 [Candidatus Gottesmanbacteria bacterium RIFCSPHIGHO2_01_FULL_39_10]